MSVINQSPPPLTFFGDQDVKTLIKTSPYTESFKNIYEEESRKEERIINLHQLFFSSEIKKVKERSSILTKFVITCILTMIMVIGISLAIVVPCILPLGTTTILISSVVIVSLFLLLSFGAGVVFAYIHHRKDHYLGESKQVFQTRILTSCCSEYEKAYYDNIIDISTLDKNGTGIVLTYFDFRDEEKKLVRLISILAIICLPFITLGAVVYNICRVLWLPPYILARILKECFKKTDDLHKFKLRDIPKEILLSLKRAVIAPFYSTAMFFSLVYSLISLRTGRVITGMVERAWNEDTPISKGYQLCKKHRDWKWEGGFMASQLGQNAYYLLGCMQPICIFLIQDWRVVLGMSRGGVYRRYPVPTHLYKKAYIEELLKESADRS